MQSKILPLTGDWREKLREYYDVSEIEIIYGGELDVESRGRDSSLIENPPAESTSRCRYVAVPYFELPGARRQQALQQAAQQADATETDESRASTSSVSVRQRTSADVSITQQAQQADATEADESRATQADSIDALSEEALEEGECNAERELADASGDDEDIEVLLPLPLLTSFTSTKVQILTQHSSSSNTHTHTQLPLPLLERESSKLSALTEISRCVTPVSMRDADGSALCATCEDEPKSSSDIYKDELITCLPLDDRSKGMDADAEDRIQQARAQSRLMGRVYRDSEEETTEAHRLGEFAGRNVCVFVCVCVCVFCVCVCLKKVRVERPANELNACTEYPHNDLSS